MQLEKANKNVCLNRECHFPSKMNHFHTCNAGKENEPFVRFTCIASSVTVLKRGYLEARSRAMSVGKVLRVKRISDIQQHQIVVVVVVIEGSLPSSFLFVSLLNV